MSKHRARQLRILAALLALLLEAAGAAAQGPPKSAPKKAVSDADLERAIRARFDKSRIAADRFSVTVQGGVATLVGTTDVVQHKGTATRLAKAAGARKVVNNIQVSEAARRKASANLSSGRRRAQVKRSEAAR